MFDIVVDQTLRDFVEPRSNTVDAYNYYYQTSVYVNYDQSNPGTLMKDYLICNFSLILSHAKELEHWKNWKSLQI